MGLSPKCLFKTAMGNVLGERNALELPEGICSSNDTCLPWCAGLPSQFTTVAIQIVTGNWKENMMKKITHGDGRHFAPGMDSLKYF